MSAFIVSKAHIDAIVDVALNGPSDSAGRWEGGPRWEAFDPRQTDWQDQEWRQACEFGTGNQSVKPVSPDALGFLLWAENIASVRFRYPNDQPGEEPGTYKPDGTPEWSDGYTYKRPQRRLTTVQAFSAISCLEYQSCEHDEWIDSEAYRVLQRLKESLIGVLPGYGSVWEVA